MFKLKNAAQRKADRENRKLETAITRSLYYYVDTTSTPLVEEIKTILQQPKTEPKQTFQAVNRAILRDYLNNATYQMANPDTWETTTSIFRLAGRKKEVSWALAN